uniref:Uncharacterized protein n=1 Tax=Heterosigma akashiwo TaxID=2829 RepID=A0A7S3XRA1_HETAK
MAPFLLAVLVQHQSSGWHRENVHRSHPLWKSRLMRLDIEKLSGHLNTGESLFDPNEGVYKSVILEKKLVDQAQELKEMRSMVEKQGNQMGQLYTCFNNLATQLSVNTLATSGALVPIPSQMEELVEKLSLGLSAGLKSAVQDEFARQRQLVGGASSPQYNSSSCPTTNCYSWGGKEDRVIPESFELSRHDQTTAQGLWDLWWIGDASSGGSGCVRVPFKKLLLAHRRDVLDLYDLRISKAAAAVEHARGEATLALAEADCIKAAAKLAEAEAQLESARKVRNNTQRYMNHK